MCSLETIRSRKWLDGRLFAQTLCDDMAEGTKIPGRAQQLLHVDYVRMTRYDDDGQ
jgi:hypothetical protein